MKCKSCNGSGKYIGFSSEEDCKDCLGKGIINYPALKDNVDDNHIKCTYGPIPHGHFDTAGTGRAFGTICVTGKVKWYNREHGWGFILQDNGSDVFVHYSQIVCGGHLFSNEVVEFEVPADQTYTTACGRSSQATKVRRAGCPSTRGA
jgi:CspA family cold shock protein